MGFLDFLFKPKVELPEDKPLFEEKVTPVEYEITTTPCDKCSNIVYTNKGIAKRTTKNSGDKWIAQISFRLKEGKPNTIYIGTYKTKEEAQKARWEFIENLK